MSATTNPKLAFDACRRTLLRNGSLVAATLGAAAFGLPSAAAKANGADGDIGVMQGALALEHEGIAAYRLAGASGLLSPETLKIARVFLGHHQQHRDSLSTLIGMAGGNPAGPKSDAEYIRALHLRDLKSEQDVIKLATRLELGATNAYAGQVTALQDRRLIHLFTQLSGDEAVHWAVLNNALGQPVPEKAYLFG